jgi:predicted nucleotidyltransferase
MRDITREQLLAELRALRPEFERRGVVGMAMFGSRSRGDNRPDSDVDLVLDILPGRPFTGLSLGGVYGLIEDRIGMESSLVVLDKYTPERFVTNIREDSVQVF